MGKKIIRATLVELLHDGGHEITSTMKVHASFALFWHGS